MAERPLGELSLEDLTARARIRDAALRLFAERGIERATIRDIAKAAGVSPGLVRHHFGSKEDLRAATDAYALEQVMSIKYRAAEKGLGANPAFLPGVQPTLLMMMSYFARSMVDGSPAAAKLFDQMVAFTEDWFAKHHPDVTDDRRALAAVIVAFQMGPMVMNEHLSRALGGDILSDTDAYLRMSMAFVDIYSRSLVSPEMAADAYAAFDRLKKDRSRTPEPGPQRGAPGAPPAPESGSETGSPEPQSERGAPGATPEPKSVSELGIPRPEEPRQKERHDD